MLLYYNNDIFYITVINDNLAIHTWIILSSRAFSMYKVAPYIQ